MLESGQKRSDRRVAISRLFGQSPENNHVELARQLNVVTRWRKEPAQWSSSGQELVSERRQGVLVGSLVDLQPVLLLGRDVAGSPQSTYRTRQQAGLVLHHREPEVAHLALASVGMRMFSGFRSR